MKHAYMLCTAVLLLALAMASVAYATSASDANNVLVEASLISQNPDPARAGEVVELKFMIENTGGLEADNIVLELLPSYPFSKIAGEDYIKNINTLQGFQQGADAAIVKYKVMVDKDASAGQNTIHLRHTSSNSGVFVTEGFDVDVTSKEFAQVIYIDKSIISPGNETSLTFTVNNIGNSPLRNLVFSWNDPQGAILPVFSDDTKYIKYLDVGGSVELQYKVAADVNANPGLYLLNLNLKFDIANGTTNQITTKAGIFVGGQTDFDVAYSESSSGQTSLSVANTGNNPAYSVTVRIPDQDGISVSGSSSSIIGNLDKGDYTIVSFQISALNFAASSAQATGQYSQARAAPSGNQTGTFQRNFTMNATPNLKVLVEYTDTVGDRYSVEKSVRLQSSSLTNSSITGFRRQQADYTVPIIIIVAVAAIGGYLFYRRRKKKAKKMQKGSVNPHEAHEGRKTGA